MCICPASSPATGEGADEVADEVASRRRCYKFFKLKPKKAGHSLVRQDPTGFKTTFETSMATEHLRKSHDKFTTRMLRVKHEKIVATSEAVVPAKRLKDLEHKLERTKGVGEISRGVQTRSPRHHPATIRHRLACPFLWSGLRSGVGSHSSGLRSGVGSHSSGLRSGVGSYLRQLTRPPTS